MNKEKLLINDNKSNNPEVMSNKQIGEMAHTILNYLNDRHNQFSMRDVATHLYDTGYRKQSEGEWIDKPTGAYGRMQSWCSACGKHSGIGGIESNRHKPFCPNCGAKMKGE